MAGLRESGYDGAPSTNDAHTVGASTTRTPLRIQTQTRPLTPDPHSPVLRRPGDGTLSPLAGDRGDNRRTQSAPAIVNPAELRLRVPSPTLSQKRFRETAHTRKSLHLPRPPRPSQEKSASSREQFDRRYDGPFGRTSLAMARRDVYLAPSLTSPIDRAKAAAGATPPTPTPTTGPPPPTHPLGGADQGVDAGYMPEPPPLNYTLRTRYWAIVIFWSFIILDTVVEPIGLYFGLWYGVGPGNPNPDEQKLSANAVFTVVTAAIGGAGILEYFLRLWRLWRKNSTCRVLGAEHSRYYFDFFHWNYTAAWLIVMVELVVGSVQHNPYIRLIAMPLATMLLVFGTQMLLIDTLRYFHVPSPIRISSMPKNSQLRPGIYSLIEDVCAVDGSGGTDFRRNLDRRYEASHVFRTMLRRLGIFWAVGCEGCAVLVTILVFTFSHDTSYTIGWSLPFVWAGIWALATTWYVKRELKKERELWACELEKGRARDRSSERDDTAQS